MKKQKKKTETD